jgi:carbon starvation protein CstA
MKTIIVMIICLCIFWMGYSTYQDSEQKKIHEMDHLLDQKKSN